MPSRKVTLLSPQKPSLHHRLLCQQAVQIQLWQGGSYVVTIGHCLRCHTPMSPETGIDYAGQLGAGGVQMGSPETPVVSANLTPHPEDGITHYTDAELAEVIKTGKRPDGTSLSPPMGPRQRLTDNDLAAVVAYLRTLPPKPYPDMSASEVATEAARDAATSE